MTEKTFRYLQYKNYMEKRDNRFDFLELGVMDKFPYPAEWFSSIPKYACYIQLQITTFSYLLHLSYHLNLCQLMQLCFSLISIFLFFWLATFIKYIKSKYQRTMSVKKIKGYKIFMDHKLGKGAYGSVFSSFIRRSTKEKLKTMAHRLQLRLLTNPIVISQINLVNSDPYMKNALVS